MTVVRERGLEGIVAKRLTGTNRPGDRGTWFKIKNRDYWRYELEQESARRHRSGSVTPGFSWAT